MRSCGFALMLGLIVMAVIAFGWGGTTKGDPDRVTYVNGLLPVAVWNNVETSYTPGQAFGDTSLALRVTCYIAPLERYQTNRWYADDGTHNVYVLATTCEGFVSTEVLSTHVLNGRVQKAGQQ